MCLCSRYGFRYMLSLFGFIVIHVWTWFWVFFTDFMISLHVSGQCLYLYTWIISLDDVHMCLSVHNGLIFVLVGLLLTTLNLHVQIYELGDCEFSWFLIRIAQWKRRSSIYHPEPFSSKPPTRLSSFPFVAHERPFVLLILVYLIVFHISYLLTM